MASYLTQIRPDQQYQTQIAYEPIMFALAARQEKFDAEYAKFEAFASNLADIDLAKEEDAKYFENNLKTVYDEIRKAGGVGDLSLTGASRIKSYIGQAADDRVVNGYVGTKKMRAYDAEWAKIKEDNPELYNEANYQFGRVNINSWLTDNQVGTKLSSYKDSETGIVGAGPVTPYTDVWEIAKDILKEKKPNITIVQTKRGVQFINEKREIISEQEVENILENLVYSDPRVQTQMRINAWDKYRYTDSQLLNEGFKEQYQNKLNKLEEEKVRVKGLLSKTKDAATKEYYNNYLDLIDQSTTNLKSNLGDWDNYYNSNLLSVKTNAYRNEFTQGVKDVYVMNNLTDISSITDQAALANLNHANSMARMREEKSLENQNENMQKMLDLYTKGDVAAANRLAQGLDNARIPTGFITEGGDMVPWQSIANNLTSKPIITTNTDLETPNIPPNEIVAKLVTAGESVKQNKDNINSILDKLGVEATVSNGNYLDVINTIDYKIKTTSDAQLISELNTVKKEVLRTELDDNAYQRQIKNLIDNGLLINADGVRIGSVGSAKKLGYDEGSGRYYIEDERTIAESALNLVKMTPNVLTVIPRFGLNILDEIASNVNLFEIAPFKNKDAINAANLYFTDEAAFRKKYPKEVVEKAEGWKAQGYRSVEDLFNNRDKVNFGGIGGFAGAVDNSITSPIKEYLDPTKALFPYSEEGFFIPTRTYYSADEMAKLLTEKITNGEITNPMLNAMTENLDEMVFQDLGVLGKKVSVNDEVSQSLYLPEISALLDISINPKDIKALNYEIKNDGLTVNYESLLEEQEPITKTIPYTALDNTPNIAYAANQYLQQNSYVNVLNSLNNNAKNNFVEDDNGKIKHVPLDIGTQIIKIPNEGNISITGGIQYSNINSEVYVPKISINNSLIENQEDLFNIYEEIGMDLTFDFNDYYMGYNTGIEAYDISLEIMQKLNRDLQLIGGKEVVFIEGTAFTIANL